MEGSVADQVSAGDGGLPDGIVFVEPRQPRLIDRVIDSDRVPSPVRLGAIVGLAGYAAVRAFLFEAPLEALKESLTK